MINLKDLYILQENLDKEISLNHGVTYESTMEHRLLALLVELGELANETRCFKFWSNKKCSEKSIIMDEYADGLHFILSLGIPLKNNVFDYEVILNKGSLADQFVNLYAYTIELKNNYNLENYSKLIQYYLNLAKSLNMDETDIKKSYLQKLNINHTRQKNNY